jgi:hypothetical protein
MLLYSDNKAFTAGTEVLPLIKIVIVPILFSIRLSFGLDMRLNLF